MPFNKLFESDTRDGCRSHPAKGQGLGPAPLWCKCDLAPPAVWPRAKEDGAEGGQLIGSLLQLINLIGLGSLRPLIMSKVAPDWIKSFVEGKSISLRWSGAKPVD